MFKRLRRYIAAIPQRKHYIEFFTALLTVPVLITVILLNLNNLNAQNEKEERDEPRIVITQQPNEEEEEEEEEEPTPTDTEECNPEVGPTEIRSPEEGEEVSDNPVNVTVRYEKGDFCSVVWAYRINNGRYSEFDDRNFALFNLPQGNIKLDLRVRSVVSGEEEVLTRNFVYEGSGNVTPELTPTSTP